jgi:hypothetical protein
MVGGRPAVWGQHLLLDVRAGALDAVRSGAAITAFAAQLVRDIDMVAYGDPLVVHFAEHVPEAAGYSLVQLIETSAITGHFCDATGDFYLDVFSCKPFDVDRVTALVEACFAPQDVRATTVARDARAA